MITILKATMPTDYVYGRGDIYKNEPEVILVIPPREITRDFDFKGDAKQLADILLQLPSGTLKELKALIKEDFNLSQELLWD